MIFNFCLLSVASKKESFNNIDNNGYQYTKNNHSYYWKINAEVFIFNSDISRKFSNPFKIIMEKIDQYSRNYNKYSRNENVFSRLLIHANTISIFVFGHKKKSDPFGWPLHLMWQFHYQKSGKIIAECFAGLPA